MSVYFWDTSALAKYYHQERGSDYVVRLLETSESKHFVSEVTLVEMLSVTASKVRSGQLQKLDFFTYRKVCFSRIYGINYCLS
jgi:predicted nucleic acid-binding protein